MTETKTLVFGNPDGYAFHDSAFCIWLGQISPTPVLVFADSLGSALDTVADDVLLTVGEEPDDDTHPEADNLPRLIDPYGDVDMLREASEDIGLSCPPGTGDFIDWVNELPQADSDKLYEQLTADLTSAGGYGKYLYSDDWSYSEVDYDDAVESAQDWLIEHRVNGKHMQAEITTVQTWWSVDGPQGSEFIPHEVFPIPSNFTKQEPEDIDSGSDEVKEILAGLQPYLANDTSEVWEIDVCTGHFTRLTAPGYLDRTRWVGPFDSVREAKQDLIDTWAE